MTHFHVVRWEPVEMPGGGLVTVPDTDFASLATAGEAHQVESGLAVQGDRCAIVKCRSRCCTLHGTRSPVAAVR
jgi:hypothetical protein